MNANVTSYDVEASRLLSHWRSSLFRDSMVVQQQLGHRPLESHENYAIFEPYMDCPPGRELLRYGDDGDGGKMLCNISGLPPNCTVFSLGSNNQYDFEQAVLAATVCTIHTFDCTVDGHSIHERHLFHKLCLGDPQHHPGYITLNDALRVAGVDEVSLLKMDIEGFEFDVVSHWTEAAMLPSQLSMEVHRENRAHGRFMSATDLAFFFLHLSNLGYGIVSKENNPLGPGPEPGQRVQALAPQASEFTFMRIESGTR